MVCDRKLAEIGFKLRSGEKCKEKFEEESRYFTNNNNNNNINCSTKNFRPFLSELDELYNQSTQQQNDAVEPSNKNSDTIPIDSATEDNNNRNGKKKRKREQQQQQVHISSSSSASDNKFEMFKSFCEEIVKKMMSQQEEMHNKLMEDMVRRDADNSKKEQDWKRMETERMNKELESMAHEQALAGDRQSAIIQFLSNFNPSDPIIANKKKKESSSSLPISSIPAKKVILKTSIITSSSSSTLIHESKKSPNSENPSSPNPNSDSGKRWPRDEVLALINLRCSTVYSNNNGPSSDNSKLGSHNSSNNNNNVPLWERISQGMLEMGFKRSAKRCKEKWENINKYFRKTKDANKKRSVDSRTCPYFDQLSTLYSKGTLVHHHNHDNDHDEDHCVDHGQGERSEISTTIATASNNNGIINNNIVVPPAFDFEF